MLDISMRASSIVLDKWYRGHIKGKRIGDEYGRLLAELATESKSKR